MDSADEGRLGRLLANPLLTRSGEFLVPANEATGPWGANTMSGQVVCAALALGAEEAIGTEGFQGVRLTVDLIRQATLDPFRILKRPLRNGRRLRMVDVTLEQGERTVAHARAAFVIPSGQPAGQVWSDPTQMPPMPAALMSPTAPERLLPATYLGSSGAPSHSFDAWRDPGEPKCMWFRLERQLVGGEDMSNWVRAAYVADTVSALTNWGSAGLQYVNSDVTMSLSRQPQGPTLGLAARDHCDHLGIAVGTATMFDSTGRIGICNASAMASEVAINVPTGSQPTE